MKLAALQRAFARRILDGDDSILGELQDSPRTDRTTLMHVYEHAYGARMAEVLEGDYEKVRQALGSEAFAEMAAAYLTARPSDHPNARYFGRALPAFLQAAIPWSETPWLAELARFEWAMGEVFQALDPPRLSVEAMAVVHPQDWPRLCFQMAPDARRIDAVAGGPEAWLALAANQDPATAAKTTTPAPWLVWRADNQAQFRTMATDEAAAYDRAVTGGTFAEICDCLLQTVDPAAAAAHAAGYLRTWIEAGLVSGYEIATDV